MTHFLVFLRMPDTLLDRRKPPALRVDVNGSGRLRPTAFLLLLFPFAGKPFKSRPNRLPASSAGALPSLGGKPLKSAHRRQHGTNKWAAPVRGAALPVCYSCLGLLEPILEVLNLLQLSGHVEQHHTPVCAVELRG